MSTKTVNALGTVLITVGWIAFALSGNVAWLLCFLAGAALILENWIRGGKS